VKLSVATTIAACLSMGAGVHAQDTYPFPPIPKTQLTGNTRDPAEYQRLSDGGDGLATTYLASRVRCKPNDAPCINGARELWKKAISQGETTGIVAERLLALDGDPSLAGTYQSSTSVCGNTIEKSDALIKAITAIDLPDKQSPTPRTRESWQTSRAEGSLGSTLILMSNRDAGMQVFLIYHDGKLKIARVVTILLHQGGKELVEQINKQVATDICPSWQGLDRAWENYLPGVLAWPPRGVHVNGPHAWFAMMGVVPDIMWYDLYVDPYHNPFTSAFTSAFKEHFAPEKVTPANPTAPSK
jgi:hypothetical protein